MKKIYKALAGICLAGALCGGAFAVSGCGDTQTDTVIGEYHYINYGVFYGVRVNVEVQTDSKGDRIRKVTIADSDYTQLSPANPDYEWTDADRENYSSQEQTLLNAYRGMYVADVLAMDVETAANGEPQGVSDDSVLISGATQSSGRLLLAVQDALLKFDNYNVYEGEYHYPNAWTPSDPHYGIRARVVVKGDKIVKVAVVDSGYTEVSQGWSGKDVWNNGLDTLLKAYEGKKVVDVMAVSVDVNSTASMGQPYTVSDSSLMITGATQGSGRLLLAVQNALGANHVTPSLYEGWNATSMLDLENTAYQVSQDKTTVTYRVVTKENGRAGSFEILISVKDGVITSYEIKVDGSTGSRYTEKIFDGFVGKDAAFFASIIGEKGDIGTNDNYEANGISTGATKSNYLCLSAALFATSNFDRAVAEGGYGEVEQADIFDQLFPGEEVEYTEAQLSSEDATTTTYSVSKVYELAGTRAGQYLVNVTGLGGYSGGSVTCWALVKTENGAFASIDEFVVESNEGQSFISKIEQSDIDAILAQQDGSGFTDFDGSDLSTGATYTVTAMVNAMNGAKKYVEYVYCGLSNPYEEWIASSLIERSTTYTVAEGIVTYNIVTAANSPAHSFSITITVGTDKKISAFEITTDGSTDAYYSNKIFDGFVGKDAAFFASIIGENGEDSSNGNYAANGIDTGATRSNYLCLSAALFATSNYSLAVANN